MTTSKKFINTMRTRKIRMFTTRTKRITKIDIKT
jgi:hypothetical protein